MPLTHTTDVTRSDVPLHLGVGPESRADRGNSLPEQRVRQIAITAILTLAIVPIIQHLFITPSIAHGQARPAYAGPAPSQRILHGWPSYRRSIAVVSAPIAAPAYSAPIPYHPNAQTRPPVPRGWEYVQAYPPSTQYYPNAPVPTWPSYGVVLPYPPTLQVWPAYPAPGYYAPPAPPVYGYAPPTGFGPGWPGYSAQPVQAPERVYYLSEEDQRVVDRLDRRLSRVKRILSESREFDTQAATILFLNEIAEALAYLPQMNDEMRAMNREMQRMNYMMTALPVLAWDLHQVNQKVGLMAWDINRTMGRMGSMMSWMPFF